MARNKALKMVMAADYMEVEQEKFDHLFANIYNSALDVKKDTVKGSQFKQPLLEFSGACPG